MKRKRGSRAKDPLASLMKTTTKINSFKRNLSNKLDKMLARIDLDRPLLMKEKLDVAYNMNKPEGSEEPEEMH